MRTGIGSTVVKLCIAAGLTGVLCAPANATYFRVTVDTASLAGTDATAVFDFSDFDGVTGDNLAIVFNFDAPGATLGAATLSPGASGDLSGQVRLEEVPPPDLPFSSFEQKITLGSSLSFTVKLTQNWPGDPLTVPDAFAFGLWNDAVDQLLLPGDPLRGFDLQLSILGGVDVLQTNESPGFVTAVQFIPVPAPLWLMLVGLPLLGAARMRHRA